MKIVISEVIDFFFLYYVMIDLIMDYHVAFAAELNVRLCIPLGKVQSFNVNYFISVVS